MRLPAIVVALPVAALAFQAHEPSSQTLPDISRHMEGLKNPTIRSSAGGHAICISGTVDITASADNLDINVPMPSNQRELTEIVTEVLQINSTFAEKHILGRKRVSGTFGIYAELCLPSNGSFNDKAIQFLVHGAGFDRTYWDPAPDYSYVDYAAQQGYLTFSYDRLGTGRSDRPDPISIVQPNIQVEVAHKLIQRLRTGGFSNKNKFKNIIGVGHSFGSVQLQAITAQYPEDLDAVVFTGMAAKPNGMPVSIASLDFTIASQNQPRRFSNLSSGYLTSNNVAGTQFFFYRTPGFDPALLDLGEDTKDTIALGELLGFGESAVANDFTGPIYTVNGENDMPNCQGNCYYPENMAAAVRTELYPAASKSSGWWIAPNCGHGLNFHYVAKEAYEHIGAFIKAHDF